MNTTTETAALFATFDNARTTALLAETRNEDRAAMIKFACDVSWLVFAKEGGWRVTPRYLLTWSDDDLEWLARFRFEWLTRDRGQAFAEAFAASRGYYDF